MGMRARVRRRLSLIGQWIIVASAVGAGYGAVSNGGVPWSVAQGAVAGILIAAILASVEGFVLDAPAGAPVRRWPLAGVLALRGSLYIAAILAGLKIAAVLVPALGGPRPADTGLARDVTFSIAVSLVANIANVVRRLVGPTLPALAVGRYRQAREEARAVLFLDLRGSTALAERLGNQRFLQFLDRVIFSATEQILEAGGEIYRYVGDEIIVTWPIRDDRIDGAALACKIAIDGAIAGQAQTWLRDFGAVPEFRGGLHAGTLVVSELGDIRREIVLLGDTMNTAARIVDLCRELKHAYLASDAAVSLTTVPDGLAAVSMGRVILRGKTEGIELFAITAPEHADQTRTPTYPQPMSQTRL
jgi:adenylate cyclase